MHPVVCFYWWVGRTTRGQKGSDVHAVTVPSPADHDEINGFQGASDPQLATCSQLQLGENKGRTRMLVDWIASVVSPYTTL